MRTRQWGEEGRNAAVAAAAGLALLAAGLATVSAGPAFAAEPKAAEARTSDQGGRYTLAPIDGGGFVRLDTQTGAMSVCRRTGTDWSCEDMQDGTAKLRAENDRLAAEIEALKAENRRLEDTFLGPDKDSAPGTRPKDDRPAFKLPSEQDVDRAFSYLQGMIKKFREKLDELEKSSPPEGKGGTPL